MITNKNSASSILSHWFTHLYFLFQNWHKKLIQMIYWNRWLWELWLKRYKMSQQWLSLAHFLIFSSCFLQCFFKSKFSSYILRNWSSSSLRSSLATISRFMKVFWTRRQFMAFYTELNNTNHTNTWVMYVSKGIYFAPDLYTWISNNNYAKTPGTQNHYLLQIVVTFWTRRPPARNPSYS